MKLQFFSISLIFCLFSCKTTQKPAQAAAPFVTWENKLLEIGKITKGEKHEMVFPFTNTSGENIQIDIVDACDCTTVEYPRGIIQPGGKNKLDVVFDSKDKDASETIEITIILKNSHPDGRPRVERVAYKYELEK